jgi:hypothetical protein
MKLTPDYFFIFIYKEGKILPILLPPSRGDYFDTSSPLRGRIKVGVRYFLSLRTLIYQGVAISTDQLANRTTGQLN